MYGGSGLHAFLSCFIHMLVASVTYSAETAPSCPQSILTDTSHIKWAFGLFCCDDFLVKPVNVGALLECLGRHLKVEWIYENQPHESSSIAPSEDEQPLHLPLKENLAELHQLADAFELNAICTLLTRFMNEDDSQDEEK